ncbi:GNAT family N-acetyltransferase [Alkaliphilus serpentinus]|uniref:GNAT family N-acetyltransferase n=1 Tax=Alkaliphilus serpentinus TaxID=1482731 RepID=A0A833HNJ0_9FIRM|nr:GNAT family N-acetyltransferase [Alkaliphilus serpentinus]KAB3529414.1 GNAT family N-acetyltransferase [Alkaliphilus serpentinus]
MIDIFDKSLEELKECENTYLSYFTEVTELNDHWLFKDHHIADMYTHNFIYIKEGLNNQDALNLVKGKINDSRDKSFINFLFHPNYHLDWKSFKDIGLEVSFLAYMTIEAEKFKIYKLNEECIVKIAEDEGMLYDGIICDINGDDSDFSFSYRSNIRKKNVFLNHRDRFFYFIAYINNVPVGKCEVFIDGNLLRVESLMVLDSFRGKRIGSNILHAVKEFAIKKNIKTIYLMAEVDDTPKEMYRKMGFDTLGKECWMLRKKENKKL